MFLFFMYSHCNCTLPVYTLTVLQYFALWHLNITIKPLPEFLSKLLGQLFKRQHHIVGFRP